MNFLPPEIKERHRRRVRQKQWFTSALLLSAVGILCFIVLWGRMRAESVYAGQLNDRARQMSVTVKRVTAMKEQAEFLEREVLSPALVSDVFRRLSLLVPETVSFESFSFRDGTHCILKGTAEDDAGVNQLYRNLVDSEAFSDVILEYSKKRKVRSRELTEFRIRCAVTSSKETPS
jgi:Tfp pilus assembly protein PilN